MSATHQGAQEAPGVPWWVVLTSYVGWGSTSGARKLISRKNRVKISAQSELRISGNIRNGFQPDLGTRNRREQRGRSNLGGAPAPPPPWRPRAIGGTLLPTREEAKEEEEEGRGLSPPLSRWRRSAAGARIVMAIYINNLATVKTNFLPLCSGVTPLLPTVIST